MITFMTAIQPRDRDRDRDGHSVGTAVSTGYSVGDYGATHSVGTVVGIGYSAGEDGGTVVPLQPREPSSLRGCALSLQH